MAKLVAIFADGLGYHYTQNKSVEALFQRIFEVTVPLRSNLGFSIGLLPSIWTSCYPRKHGYWAEFFIKKPYEPKAINLRRLQWYLTTLALYGIKRIQILFSKESSLYPSIPGSIANHFCRADIKLSEPFKSSSVPSIFSVLDNNEVTYEYLFRDRIRDADIQLINKSDVVTFHLGEIDKYGHAYGPDSDLLIKKILTFLKMVNKIAEKTPVFLFSDHGMFPIVATWDLLHLLSKLNCRLGKDYLVFLDATMARFWFFTHRAEEEITRSLSTLSAGHFLSKDEIIINGMDFPHNAYGDKIFLLNPGIEIYPNFFHPFYKNLFRGMHGYTPLAQNSFALFASTFGKKRSTMESTILDTSPTILKFLGISPPEEWKGSAIV